MNKNKQKIICVRTVRILKRVSGIFFQIAENVVQITTTPAETPKKVHFKFVGTSKKINIKTTINIVSILKILTNLLKTLWQFSFFIQLYNVENEKYNKENDPNNVKNIISRTDPCKLENIIKKTSTGILVIVPIQFIKPDLKFIILKSPHLVRRPYFKNYFIIFEATTTIKTFAFTILYTKSLNSFCLYNTTDLPPRQLNYPL